MNSDIEYIRYQGELYAIIIRNDYHETGIKFLTDGKFSQQLAYMQHPAGEKIVAHVHNHMERNVIHTQEVLLIKKGILRADFYTPDERKYFGSTILRQGDVILLCYGGHGFSVVEEVEMIEVKQGPYLGENDKERFEGVKEDHIRMIED